MKRFGINTDRVSSIWPFTTDGAVEPRPITHRIMWGDKTMKSDRNHGWSIGPWGTCDADLRRTRRLCKTLLPCFEQSSSVEAKASKNSRLQNHLTIVRFLSVSLKLMDKKNTKALKYVFVLRTTERNSFTITLLSVPYLRSPIVLRTS